MSTPDWSRATIRVRVPVVHTASEDVQEFDIPLANLWTLMNRENDVVQSSIHRLMEIARTAQ